MDPERITDTTLRRAAVVQIYEVADRMVLLAPDGGGHELAGDSAALARAVLDFLAAPRTPAEVLRHVEALAGGPIERPAVIDDLLRLLLRARAVEVVTSAARPHRRGPGPRVVLGLTGAVASMHAPMTILRLQARGFEVRVAATEDALRFVRVEALEALTHRPVVRGMWPGAGEHGVPHIDLAQWADAVLIAPASATTIARLAAGDYSSVVSAIALATRAPVLVAPSMNPAMYAGAPVQRNLARLVEDGVHVAHPVSSLEVAERPEDRTPVLGGAPPPEVLVRLLEAILRARAAAEPAPPRDAAGWDRIYRGLAELPWQSDTPDPDLLAALERVAPRPTSVLEIGAGLGTLAVAAAAAGHHVVATDISGAALEHAQARAPAAPVVWLQDDIADTRLRGTFHVVLDRGCLHVLDEAAASRWAAAVARLTAPGGAVVLKTLEGDAATARGVKPWTAEALRSLVGADLDVEHSAPSTLPGPGDAPAAHLFVLRRRDR